MFYSTHRFMTASGSTRSEVISEIRRMIHNYQTNNNQKIELVRVPSHVSIPGNDQADRCAKESLSLEDIEPVEYSYSEFCSIVSSRINQKWSDMLRNLDTTRYQIDPKIPNQTKPNHPCVAICKVATRLRTNNVLRDHQFNAIKCRCGHVSKVKEEASVKVSTIGLPFTC
ncbi:hypothetical protein LOTGIDRAFT_153510 [Lottia gigantea]|uniref:Uncharacterized protein n=1 Tax=Lottia gigantea TaxID=225164 RepID=V4BY39_LOTGI|nr:hypothetical protein LOTGIDRAFT_153510 [Lottia gigantea]ESO94029.1 hypothetical protein LOTGIDRAFT_153510 [Lottia gigantea]